MCAAGADVIGRKGIAIVGGTVTHGAFVALSFGGNSFIPAASTLVLIVLISWVE